VPSFHSIRCRRVTFVVVGVIEDTILTSPAVGKGTAAKGLASVDEFAAFDANIDDNIAVVVLVILVLDLGLDQGHVAPPLLNLRRRAHLEDEEAS
jgi:hypothetical protein